MIIRVLARIVSRALWFAIVGAVVMAFVGALEGALSGALLCCFGVVIEGMMAATLPGTFGRGGPLGGNILETMSAGGFIGGLSAAYVGTATGAIAFAVVGVLTAKRQTQQCDLALSDGLAQAMRGSLWGVLLGAPVGISTALLLALVLNGTNSGGIVDYVFSGYILGIIGGFIIGTFVGALYGAFGKSLPANAREFIHSVKRLSGLGKA